jgi:hypothetical protein
VFECDMNVVVCVGSVGGVYGCIDCALGDRCVCI